MRKTEAACPRTGPVFVTVLKANLPGPDEPQAEAAQLTLAVAQACGRSPKNVHIIHQPEGAGSVAFGGGQIVLE